MNLRLTTKSQAPAAKAAGVKHPTFFGLDRLLQGGGLSKVKTISTEEKTYE